MVPGCCAAEKPELPKRDVVPPNGFEVVLVDPKSPPLLVLVPKPDNQPGILEVMKMITIFSSIQRLQALILHVSSMNYLI